MDYNQLKTDIVEFIRTNNNEEITGEVLQHILISMVDALGKGYQFAGVATPHTLIPQTDEKVVWLLGSGNYENFGDPFVVAENEFAVMMYDDSFELEKVAVGRPVDSEITEDGINPVEGKVIYEKFAGVEEDILQLDEAKQDKLEYDQHPTEGSDNPVTSAGVYEADMLLQQAIEAILLLIPSAASELNKLADKNFVNSSIETATATFRGTYNLVTDLDLQVGATHQYIAIALSMAITDADNNDYAFVQVPTSDETPTEIAVTQRYKYNGTNWDFEYDLNNSGFTAAQWEAINSGINDLLVGKLADLPTLTELTALFDETRESLESLNGQVSENTSDIAQLRALYEALQQSEPEIIAPTDTWPVEDPSGTVIYRVVDRENTPPEYYSDYMWNGTEMVLMARYNNAVDDRPKKGSTNFVESGGIFDNMGALDISELNATEDPHTPAVYEGLSAAIAAVPSDYQAGGMSVKFKNEENEYECYQLTSAEWSTDINDWISINLIKELDAQAGATKYEDIPFSVEKQYIKRREEKGEIAFSNNQNITQYIPVSEGDDFLYSGVTPANSLSAAGYEYTNGAYVFKDTLVLSTGSVAVEDKYIIIPAGITHIVACCNTTALSSSSFRKIKKSSLEKLKENLGETGSQTIYEASAYTLGQYVNASGSWIINNSAKSLILEVKAGDIIELYETTGNSNVCTFAKKITDTTFEPLLILDSGVLYEKVSYNVTEDMSLCISVLSTIDTPRMTVVRNDMKSDIENLKDTQEDLVAYNKWLEEYDIKLGVMFENIAVIGDSMSRGTLSEVGDQEDTNSFGASYLSCLAKRWGCKSLFHYAKSGTGAWTWLNDAQYGIGRLLADAQAGKIFNAYFIAYGHNDGGDTTHYSGVGEATDTAATVDTSGATPSCEAGNTFCAYYKAIIDNIRTVAPHAMIFLLPEYDNVMMSTGREAYRQAIKDIADLYYENGDKLVHHLDTGGVPVPDMTLGTHYSTIGYAYIAKRINNEVVKVIYNHRNDNEIKYFGSYNTDKTANSPWGVDNSFITTEALDAALDDYTTTANLTTLLAGKQDVIEDLSTIRSGASAGATAVQPATLNSALSDTVAESGVYDVTANNNNAKFASLSALLSSENLDTLIPEAKRKGGMSIKFVLSSDNKYVQYRLMSDSFNTTPANWQGVDDEPVAGSENLITSGGVAAEFNKVDKVLGKCTIANGSNGNIGNAYLVHTSVVSTKGAKYAIIKVNKPNETGYHYAFGWAITSSKEDIGVVTSTDSWYGFITKIDVTATSTDFILDLSNYPNVVGVSFTIGEYDYQGNYHILRASDFEEGDVIINCQPGIDNLITEKLHKELWGLDIISFEGVRGYVKADGTVSTDNSYRTWYIERSYFIGNQLIVGQCSFVHFFDMNKVWLSCFASWSGSFIIQLSESDIPANCAFIVVCSLTATTNLKLYNKEEYLSTQRLSPIYPCMRNGSLRYSSTKKIVSTAMIYPAYGASFARITILKDAGTGFHYEILYSLYASIPQITSDTIPTSYQSSWIAGNVIEANMTGYEGMGFSIKKLNSSGEEEAFTYDELTDGDVIIERISVPKVLTPTMSAYYRNKDKEAMLAAAVRSNKKAEGSMDFMSLIITDSHGDALSESNAVVMADNFQYIQALLHLGDFCGSDATISATNFNSARYNKLLGCKKPFYFVAGNHDVGNSVNVANCITNSQYYTRFIQPMVDAGLLEEGEYSNDKGYYYHDFTSQKIRLICIYEYDDPNDLDPNDNTKYRYRRGDSIISQAQAEWFCDTLNSTPADYGIIVAMHNPFSPLADCVTTAKFNYSNFVGGQGAQRLFSTDIWADIVDAWVNKFANYTCTMVCTGNASYLNTDGKYYEFSYDFSGRNTTAKFICFIGGHVHRDCVWKHRNYQYQYQISPVCSNSTYQQSPSSDIRRTNTDGLAKDSLTAIGYDYDNQAIRLVKLGVNVTEDMKARDYELIETQEA